MFISTRDFSNWVHKEAQDYVLDLTYKVWSGVINLTPVKTGQTRASWNMSKNEPNFSTIDEGVDLQPPTRPELSFSGKEYPVVFIANGKPHIRLLEEGSSKQAPNGMVQVTLDSLDL